MLNMTLINSLAIIVIFFGLTGASDNPVMSPIRRSYRLLKLEGWKVATAQAPHRHWGFAEIMGTKGPPIRVKLVVVVETAYLAVHVGKVLENKRARDLLAMGWLIEIHGWVKDPGKDWVCVRALVE